MEVDQRRKTKLVPPEVRWYDDPVHDDLSDCIEHAMWDGDDDLLHEIARCECCCGEHTWTTCPARVWNGCRSGLEYGEEEPEREYAMFYQEARGRTRDQWYASYTFDDMRAESYAQWYAHTRGWSREQFFGDESL